MTEQPFHVKSLDRTRQMLLHSNTLVWFSMALMNFRSFSFYQLGLLCFSLLLLILHALPAPIRSLLEYHRAEPTQLWRAFTAHLLHSNEWHLLMNLGAFLLMLLLHWHYYRLTSFVLILLTGCAGISLLLFLFSTDIHIYVGLSGWLHCFLTVGAMLDVYHKIQSGWLILAGVTVKVAYEQWQGPDAELARLIDANVAIDAHLYGLICGLVVGCCFVIRLKWAENQPRPES